MSALICFEDKSLTSCVILELASVSSQVLCGRVGWPVSIEQNTVRKCGNIMNISDTHVDIGRTCKNKP